MRNKLTLLFLFVSFYFYPQQQNSTIYNDFSVYSHLTKDTTSIAQIVSLFKKGAFTKENNQKIYKKLGNKTWWYHFPLQSKQATYVSISNPYLSYGKVYLTKEGSIIPLQKVSYSKDFPFKYTFYKYPVWKIPSNISVNDIDIFIELKNRSARSRLEFHIENENQFLKRIEIEYFFTGLFIAFLSSMILILLYFSILKREYSVIFYAVYIFCMLIEFLAGKGLGIQFLWSDSDFLVKNIRSLSQTLGTLCIGLFYLKFYKLNAQQKLPKSIFKWGVYLTIPLLILYLYKYFSGGMGSFYLYVWITLKLIAIIWFFNHLYLTASKQIPFYLVIAFALPIIAIITNQSINPSVYAPNWWITASANLFYYALIIEIILFTRYIFGSVIATQRNYFQLKKISDELKYNFQNKTLEIQTQERNRLVNNVHDSFGGYLEALKLRLLNTSKNTPEKIQEILDAFYKEYRYLLNSLHSPKINSENFVANLIEFLDKLNKLTNHRIKHHFSLEDSQLSQEKCEHIYSIISELTTNAIKHSKASEIHIKISQNNQEQISLIVIDNGIGFDEQLISKKGFGLDSMKTRVKQMHGHITIDSKKNSGTTITINIPINE